MKNLLFALGLFLLSTFGFSQTNMKNLKITNQLGDDVLFQSRLKEKEYHLFVFWSLEAKPSLEYLNNIKDSYHEWVDENSIDLTIINVDKKDKKDKAEAYATKNEWNYEMFFDFDQKSKDVFHYSDLPHTVIIKNDGRFMKTFHGYKQGDEMMVEEKISELFDDSSSKEKD